MWMVVVLGRMAGVVMVMHQALGMVMGFLSAGMGVHKPVGVLMQMLMGVGVHRPAMAVGMVMDMEVRVSVLMFVLQFPDGGESALPV